MCVYIDIYVDIYNFSYPVASCGGVSQASSPRSGNARSNKKKMSGRPMRPRHRVMPRARGPFPAQPALGSRTFIREAHLEFMNSSMLMLLTFGSDICDDTNSQVPRLQ